MGSVKKMSFAAKWGHLHGQNSKKPKNLEVAIVISSPKACELLAVD